MTTNAPGPEHGAGPGLEALIEHEVHPDDQHYRDSLGKVEPYGIDHIPDAERHGSLRDQFTTWAGGNMILTIVLLGFYPVFYGLGFWPAIASVVIGTGFGCVMMGVMSAMGIRLGVPVQVQARGSLGYYGNFVPSAIVNVFASVGWAAVNTIIGVLLLQEVIGVPFWLAAVVLTAVQAAVAVFGYNMIHFVNRLATILIGILFIVVTVLALAHSDTSFGADPEAPFFVSGVGGFITSCGLFFSYLLAWAPFASDYSRYLPVKTSMLKGGLATALGNFVVVTWLGCIGVLTAHVAGDLGPAEVISQLTGGFATVALLGFLAGTIPGNSLNLYGGALSLMTLRIPVRREIAVIIISIASVLFALWAQDDIYGKFYNFLVLTAYLISPYVVVVILDYFLCRRAERPLRELYDPRPPFRWGFVAWAAGCLAAVPFWTWAAWSGPVATAHPEWGDLSYYAGALASAVVFLILYRVGLIPGRGQARKASVSS
ncbi:purine-cytosine permease family protein [Nakamurella sp. GG22]